MTSFLAHAALQGWMRESRCELARHFGLGRVAPDSIQPKSIERRLALLGTESLQAYARDFIAQRTFEVISRMKSYFRLGLDQPLGVTYVRPHMASALS